MKDIKIFNESRTGFTKEFLELIKWQKARLNACISTYKRFKLDNNHDLNFALKLQIKLEHARRTHIKHIFKKGQRWITKYIKASVIDKPAFLNRFEVLENCFNYSYKQLKIRVTWENIIY